MEGQVEQVGQEKIQIKRKAGSAGKQGVQGRQGVQEKIIVQIRGKSFDLIFSCLTCSTCTPYISHRLWRFLHSLLSLIFLAPLVTPLLAFSHSGYKLTTLHVRG